MDVQLDRRHPEAANDGAARRARDAQARATPANGPRLGELLGGLSHALDMAAGQPAGHAMRSCWVGQQVGRIVGLSTGQRRDLFYVTLLKDAGCSSDAARLSALFLTDDLFFKRAQRASASSR